MKKLIGCTLLSMIVVSCKKKETPVHPGKADTAVRSDLDSIPRAFRVCKTSFDTTPSGKPDSTDCNYILYVFRNPSDKTYIVEQSTDTIFNPGFTPLYSMKYSAVIPNVSPNIVKANFTENKTSGSLTYNKDTDSIFISVHTRFYGAGAAGYNMSGKSIDR